MYVCMYACMYVCMYVCICVYVHIYIYTYTPRQRGDVLNLSSKSEGSLEQKAGRTTGTVAGKRRWVSTRQRLVVPNWPKVAPIQIP